MRTPGRRGGFETLPYEANRTKRPRLVISTGAERVALAAFRSLDAPILSRLCLIDPPIEPRRQGLHEEDWHHDDTG